MLCSMPTTSFNLFWPQPPQYRPSQWTLNITQNHKSGLSKDFPVNFYVHTPQEQSKAYIVKFRCLPNVTFWSTFYVHIPKNKIHSRSNIRGQLSQNFYSRTGSPNIRPNHPRTIKRNTQIHQTKVLFRNR
ncbi:hypothetical protein K450DRAFT_245119 [Umbelopsis ramanniana AG]|uniref:Uncharacterized protein n=1 Tax=Umbelopsis ramanniana AG TaxID=1314678 RepID=A0AAD5E7Q5_UMBRA|nr:uncharacterized protein K450DRAFT_245119 [Umbelopsis ramanniana AG]KAI8578916.1 hypothetical protein K450DRAFT_245119 [Umbelopsis ramanniana AG]